MPRAQRDEPQRHADEREGEGGSVGADDRSGECERTQHDHDGERAG